MTNQNTRNEIATAQNRIEAARRAVNTAMIFPTAHNIENATWAVHTATIAQGEIGRERRIPC